MRKLLLRNDFVLICTAYRSHVVFSRKFLSCHELCDSACTQKTAGESACSMDVNHFLAITCNYHSPSSRGGVWCKKSLRTAIQRFMIMRSVTVHTLGSNEGAGWWVRCDWTAVVIALAIVDMESARHEASRSHRFAVYSIRALSSAFSASSSAIRVSNRRMMAWASGGWRAMISSETTASMLNVVAQKRCPSPDQFSKKITPGCERLRLCTGRLARTKVQCSR